METQQVLLGRFKETDLEDFYQYARIPGLGEAAGWRHLENLAEAAEDLPSLINNPFAYALEDKKTGRVIGHLTIHDESAVNDSKEKELGFVLHPDYRRRGIIFEAVTVVLADLFTQGIEKIYAGYFEDNEASEALIKKLGFTFSGTSSYTSPTLQQTFKMFDYVMTREKYLQTIQEATYENGN